jgi:WD40 repeat protein
VGCQVPPCGRLAGQLQLGPQRQVREQPQGVALSRPTVSSWSAAGVRVVLTVCGRALAACRLWDVHISKSRQVLRGHVDSVNDIQWQPFGSAIATGE